MTVTPGPQPTVGGGISIYLHENVRPIQPRVSAARAITYTATMTIEREYDSSSLGMAPSPTPKKPKKTASATASASPSPAKSGWTPDSRGVLIERLLTLGWQHAKLDQLVQEVR